MAGPAVVIGGRIIAGAASALYNSITGASEAHAPTDVPKNKLNKYNDKKYKLRPRKAASSAEKSG